MQATAATTVRPRPGLRLNVVLGLCQDGAGNIYIADFNNTRVRRISYNHAPVFTGSHTQNTHRCVRTPPTAWERCTADNGYRQRAGRDMGHGDRPHPRHAVQHLQRHHHRRHPHAHRPVLCTPTIGYTGLDSFTVKVTDCSGAGADTTKIVVIVNPVPPSAIAGNFASVCAA